MSVPSYSTRMLMLYSFNCTLETDIFDTGILLYYKDWPMEYGAWGISIVWFICTFIDHPHIIWEWWAFQDSSMHAMPYAVTWTTPLRHNANNIPYPCRNKWDFATLLPKCQAGRKETVKEEEEYERQWKKRKSMRDSERGGRVWNSDSFPHSIMHLLWLR